jgi:hypothetical protein
MLRHSRPSIARPLCAVLLFAAAPLSGCVIAGDDPELDAESLGVASDEISLPPATCQEIKDKYPDFGDGAYTLHLGNDPAKPWTVYCHNMDSTPTEYLRLKNVGASANYGQYTAGGAAPGTSVRTQYTRVRIDPVTLNVHIGDQTFATSTGQLTHGGEAVTSMPFGVAMSCDSTASGVANIDLTGTPFAVAPSEFVQGGYFPSGTSTYSGDGQVVDITGGGYCGWTSPTPDTFNPFNQTGGFQLQLQYRHPSTCKEIADAVIHAWDGKWTLFVDHDPTKPWTAYCHNIASTAEEYLQLVNVGPSSNFAQYTAGGAAPGTSVRTQYTRVRIDPMTLNVDIGDQRFTTSTGQLFHGGEAVTSMPYGVAMSCDSTASGVANVDLTGTPFAVAPSEFVQGGFFPSGTSTYGESGQVVNITGGGFCGWTSPTPDMYNPFNQSGDFQLALHYGAP